MIAARSVHFPSAVAQTPLPGFASAPSAVVSTRNVWSAAKAAGETRTGETRRRGTRKKVRPMADLRVWNRLERRRPAREEEVDQVEDVGDVCLRVPVDVAEADGRCASREEEVDEKEE